MMLALWGLGGSALDTTGDLNTLSSTINSIPDVPTLDPLRMDEFTMPELDTNVIENMGDKVRELVTSFDMLYNIIGQVGNRLSSLDMSATANEASLAPLKYAIEMEMGSMYAQNVSANPTYRDGAPQQQTQSAAPMVYNQYINKVDNDLLVESLAVKVARKLKEGNR